MEILQGGIYSLLNAIALAMVFGVLINKWSKQEIIKLASMLVINAVLYFFFDMSTLRDVLIVATIQVVVLKFVFEQTTFAGAMLVIKAYLVMLFAGMVITNLFIIFSRTYIDFRSVYRQQMLLASALYLPVATFGALFMRYITSIKNNMQTTSLKVQRQLLISNILFVVLFAAHQRIVADFSFYHVQSSVFDINEGPVQLFMLFNYMGITSLFMVINILANRGIVSQKNFEKFKIKAEIDRMSGAFTRDAGLQHLTRAMNTAKMHQQPLTICYLDVNDLKIVNDKYGHQTGDLYIRTIAGVVKECLRDFDCMARLGGDEFLIVFSKCTIGQGKKAWQRINEKFDEINQTNEYIFTLSASAGLCQFNERRHKSVKVFIHEADERMYREKRILKSKKDKNSVVR